MSNTKSEYGISISSETLSDGSTVFNLTLVSPDGEIYFHPKDEGSALRMAAQMRSAIEGGTGAEVDDLNA